MTEKEPMLHCVIWPCNSIDQLFANHIAHLDRTVAPEDFLDFGFEAALKEYVEANRGIVRI